MRYMIVTYYKKPSGSMDEVVGVSKRLRTKDWQSASVIMDFKTRTIDKCSLEGAVVPKDWSKIRDFYHQHYEKIIEELEAINGSKNLQPPQDHTS